MTNVTQYFQHGKAFKTRTVEVAEGEKPPKLPEGAKAFKSEDDFKAAIFAAAETD